MIGGTEPFTAAARVGDYVAAAYDRHLTSADDDSEHGRILDSLGLSRALADLEHTLASARLENLGDATLVCLFELARVWHPRDHRAAELEARPREHIESRHRLTLPRPIGTNDHLRTEH